MKKIWCIFLLIIVLTGCSDTSVQTIPVQSDVREGNDVHEIDIEVKAEETVMQEEEKEIEESETQTEESEPQKEQILELKEEKIASIEACLSEGTFVYEAIRIEEMVTYLNEKGICFEAYYEGNERINMTLDDGTYLVFLQTQNMDGEDTGYQLMLKDNAFNANGFQENYTNAYDVNTDEYYYPNLSEKVWKAEELIGLNKLDCAIVRNQIFAKHGRCFNDSLLQNIFAVKSWYEPKYSAAEFDLISQELLTETERENLKIITQYEKEWGYQKNMDASVKEVKMFLSGTWIDLDGDGVKEQIFYLPEGVGEETAYMSYPETVTIKVEDSRIVHDGVNTGREGYLVSMDGIHHYIVVGDYGMSADHSSTFYEYKNGELCIVGQMYAHPKSLVVYENEVIAPEETVHLQCQPVKFRYELIDGIFVKQEDTYYEYRQNIVIAQQEIQLYSSPDTGEIGIRIATGEEAQVMGGDMEKWVLLRKVSTGEEGWLRVENMDNCILQDGEIVYSVDLFEGLYFYG